MRISYRTRAICTIEEVGRFLKFYPFVVDSEDVSSIVLARDFGLRLAMFSGVGSQDERILRLRS